jgi:hypothetical protein
LKVPIADGPIYPNTYRLGDRRIHTREKGDAPCDLVNGCGESRTQTNQALHTSLSGKGLGHFHAASQFHVHKLHDLSSLFTR